MLDGCGRPRQAPQLGTPLSGCDINMTHLGSSTNSNFRFPPSQSYSTRISGKFDLLYTFRVRTKKAAKLCLLHEGSHTLLTHPTHLATCVLLGLPSMYISNEPCGEHVSGKGIGFSYNEFAKLSPCINCTEASSLCI